MTLPLIHAESARRTGAPDAEWRMITASAPIACNVSAVSLRDSPLLSDEPFAPKLITSADSRLAAASKEIRVRVESSANRLTIVRPRSVGSFFIGPSLARAISIAVSKIRTASSLERSDIDNKWRIICSRLRSRELRLDHQSRSNLLSHFVFGRLECFFQQNPRE